VEQQGMTERDKTALWLALRGPIELRDKADAKLVALNDEADKLAFADLQSITPAVEEIERNAEARGKFQQLLELTHERWKQKTEMAAWAIRMFP
jgi:hypothetical protein